MKIVYHTNMSEDQWFGRSILEQMANVGSEVFRAISWRDRNAEYSRQALYRALELLDLTIEDRKNLHRLKELLRVRELLVDYFVYDNVYGSSDQEWQKYFFDFNLAANATRHSCPPYP